MMCSILCFPNSSSEVLIMPLRLAKITKHQDQMAPVATLWQCEPAVDALQVWLKYITHIQIKQPEPVKSNLVTKIEGIKTQFLILSAIYMQ